ncbi:cobalt-factor II C(20)-methyltransferase [Companilactobacillus sp.]|jgi:precorrin-2/cobalt-factor-2 C20-methyltransferase|uniref:cobalt-factor II C(20)-methyltransferase n=1 Tax=Companilactobacillus sp. TaxID=2767905 RepID=UPI0025BED3F4|nr:cobalt-factor II C(20)-methyltransferase [Companilactobacillus sp.]MCH4008618.1 cobalt-factor II C(20)-methyltransferase [Companilactobacillus sp.]MCH4051203.1 cobalt-factor II C(20)-methyltransferase [Companilactobacillus sp.]MCH4076561.1 cobalt-factor II C(20)-methyltransferase [Companilactobacillus sp.]MCH4125136.1 cobalt-factor II C(20)-methyltransferase [Companilactobacillus sp.]MCH4131676.1 cobalt-factor II C(20)-methyltransferase [Companilactobacillus sp.]
MSKLYGIGVGPGDSELITVKATKMINQLDILYTPIAHNGMKSTALRIATPYLNDKTEIKERHFPMTRNVEERQKSWEAIANDVVKDVKSGHDVGFLTLGDTSVYSTFSYIQKLVETQIEVEIVAGISSFSQIAATLKKPLMLDEESLTVVPATKPIEEIQKFIADNDNLVLMKISSKFSDIFNLLKELNLLDNSTIISNASMENEKIIPVVDLNAESKIPYFSTMLIKK